MIEHGSSRSVLMHWLDSGLHKREERANRAKVLITQHFDNKLQVFLNFVLSQYVKVGVEELEKETLGQLLRLRYGSIQDALRDLGQPPEQPELMIPFEMLPKAPLSIPTIEGLMDEISRAIL